MANIELPKGYSADFSNPKVKPIGEVEIDWNHPLTRGLKRYWLGDSHTDLAAGQRMVADSGTVNVGVVNGSKALIPSQSGEQGALTETVISPITGSQNRTFLGEVSNLVHGAEGNIFHIHDTGTSGSGARWSVRVAGSGSSDVLRIEIQGGGHTSFLQVLGGTNHFVGCRLDGTQLQHHSLYVDDNKEDASGSNSIVTSSTATCRLGGRDASASSLSSSVDSIKWGALWDRALTDEEIESIRLSPYQFLKPKQAPIYFTLEAAGGEDALLADDVQSTSNVTTPVVGQEHALISTDVQSTSELSPPVLAQVHVLNNTSVQSTSNVTTPVVAQVHVLNNTSVQSTSEVTTPSLAQVHVLNNTSVTSTSEVSNPAIFEPSEDALTANNVVSLSSVSTPSLSEGVGDFINGKGSLILSHNNQYYSSSTG